MASPPIDVHCDAPDPAIQPQTFTEACAIIDTLLRAEMTGADAYLPYVVSNTTPAVDDQDKIWIQLDSVGRPIAIKKFYGGNWRPIYTGRSSEVKMFTGDPALYFDGTGRGLIGNSWDGWALMNGQNGTPNWTDKFVVSGHMDDSGGINKFSAGWQTGVTGAATKNGGTDSVTLGPHYIPTPPKDAVVVDLFSATGDARDPSGAMFGKHSLATGPTGQVELIPADPGNLPPFSFSILPPYIACGFAIFIGY